MKTKICPNCRNEAAGDPQSCPACQSGLRKGRMNAVGRFIPIMVVVATAIALAVLAHLVLDWYAAPKETESSLFAILKIAGVGIVWYFVFWFARQLEAFARYT